MAAHNDRWRYAEGYAYNAVHDFFYEHAWLLDPEGRAWETTWTDTNNMAYLGLAFELNEVVSMTKKSKEPMLFGDWDRGFPLLKSHLECCGRTSTTAR